MVVVDITLLTTMFLFVNCHTGGPRGYVTITKGHMGEGEGQNQPIKRQVLFERPTNCNWING